LYKSCQAEEDVAAEGVEVRWPHGWRDGRRGWREVRAERRRGRRREWRGAVDEGTAQGWRVAQLARGGFRGVVAAEEDMVVRKGAEGGDRGGGPRDFSTLKRKASISPRGRGSGRAKEAGAVAGR
jgi:hypothetical protein